MDRNLVQYIYIYVYAHMWIYTLCIHRYTYRTRPVHPAFTYYILSRSPVKILFYVYVSRWTFNGHVNFVIDIDRNNILPGTDRTGTWVKH